MPASIAALTEDEIASRLANAPDIPFDRSSPETARLLKLLPGKPQPAAVLIPFLKQDDQWHLLFIRRSVDHREHSGQVAFPGGRSESADLNIEQTALREAWEEVGLHPSDVHVLGQLGAFPTITRYVVTPIVASIPWPYPLRPETDEVSRTFTIPLDWLADPANHEERRRSLPPPFAPIPVTYFRPYDGEVLWGISASFTLALLHILQHNGSGSE